MDLKEMNYTTTSADIKLQTKSERNKSDTQGMNEILFSDEEGLSETSIGNNSAIKDNKKPIYSEVATLDWIKTWRAFEIS